MKNKYNVACHDDGWPLGITKEQKDVMTAVVRTILTKAGDPGISLHNIYYWTSQTQESRNVFGTRLLDFRYSCIEKALEHIAECRYHLLK